MQSSTCPPSIQKDGPCQYQDTKPMKSIVTNSSLSKEQPATNESSTIYAPVVAQTSAPAREDATDAHATNSAPVTPLLLPMSMHDPTPMHVTKTISRTAAEDATLVHEPVCQDTLEDTLSPCLDLVTPTATTVVVAPASPGLNVLSQSPPRLSSAPRSAQVTRSPQAADNARCGPSTDADKTNRISPVLIDTRPAITLPPPASSVISATSETVHITETSSACIFKCGSAPTSAIASSPVVLTPQRATATISMTASNQVPASSSIPVPIPHPRTYGLSQKHTQNQNVSRGPSPSGFSSIATSSASGAPLSTSAPTTVVNTKAVIAPSIESSSPPVFSHLSSRPFKPITASSVSSSNAVEYTASISPCPQQQNSHASHTHLPTHSHYNSQHSLHHSHQPAAQNTLYQIRSNVSTTGHSHNQTQPSLHTSSPQISPTFVRLPPSSGPSPVPSFSSLQLPPLARRVAHAPSRHRSHRGGQNRDPIRGQSVCFDHKSKSTSATSSASRSNLTHAAVISTSAAAVATNSSSAPKLFPGAAITPQFALTSSLQETQQPSVKSNNDPACITPCPTDLNQTDRKQRPTHSTSSYESATTSSSPHLVSTVATSITTSIAAKNASRCTLAQNAECQTDEPSQSAMSRRSPDAPVVQHSLSRKRDCLELGIEDEKLSVASAGPTYFDRGNGIFAAALTTGSIYSRSSEPIPEMMLAGSRSVHTSDAHAISVFTDAGYDLTDPNGDYPFRGLPQLSSPKKLMRISRPGYMCRPAPRRPGVFLTIPSTPISEHSISVSSEDGTSSVSSYFTLPSSISSPESSKFISPVISTDHHSLTIGGMPGVTTASMTSAVAAISLEDHMMAKRAFKPFGFDTRRSSGLERHICI